jgi:uncharacterized protein YggE
MRTIQVTAAVVAAALLSAGCGGTGGQAYPPTIMVSGSGTACAEPDVADITFGVDISRDDPGDAVDDAAVMMQSAMDAAAGLGVDPADLETTSYSMWVEQEYDYQTYEYTGRLLYHVTHYASADVRDLDTVGEVLSALVSAGANTISGVSFVYEDESALRDRARELAVADARRIADLLAAQLGVHLGSPISVSEWVDYYPMSRASTGWLGGDACTEVPPVSGGAFSITLNVQVSYSID